MFDGKKQCLAASNIEKNRWSLKKAAGAKSKPPEREKSRRKADRRSSVLYRVAQAAGRSTAALCVPLCKLVGESMMNTRQVAIRDIPDRFRDEIHAHVRLFSSTILVDRGSESYTSAGTLCGIGGRRGVATARHVWESLRFERSFYLMAGQAHIEIQPELLQAWVPPVSGLLPSTEAQIPDIAFLLLSAPDCATLEAYGKAFFSIDRRLSETNEGPHEEDGYWMVCGSPQALLEERTVPSLVYGTYVQERSEFDSWDFLNMALDLEANPELPQNFGGVSGGGIWRTRFGTDEAATQFVVENRYRDVFWVGVAFYQTPLDGRSLVAHGPRSIYERLHEGVSSSFGT
jgi:hypothetical protein